VSRRDVQPPRAISVALLARRGRFLSAEPFFERGRAIHRHRLLEVLGGLRNREHAGGELHVDLDAQAASSSHVVGEGHGTGPAPAIGTT